MESGDFVMTMDILASVGIDPLFTGVYLSYGQNIVLLKSGSPQNDISTSVLNGLKQAGRAIGFQDLHELLVSVPIIRLCTSMVQTGLLLHLGQPIGLLVSTGLVDIGRRVLTTLGLPRDMVIDIPAPHDPEAEGRVRLAINRLLNQGARCIGVCLTGSWRNPLDEHLIRTLIDRQYPPHYLGSIPIILSSDYEPGLTDEERIVALAIDCYMGRMLQNHINEIKTALECKGFAGVLLIAEGNGGLSPVPRMRPSKAAMVTQASLFTVARYWIKKVAAQRIALKIGSFNSEITIIDGRESTNANFSSLMPENTMGGIASILKRRSGRFILTVPDNSTGLGTNCLNSKERAPTLLDAMLILGYVNRPSSLGRTGFLFDQSSARDAMARLIGRESSEVEAAALRACHDVADDIACIIRRQIKKRGIDASTSAFLVCGEAGGILACAIAERLGWNIIYTIPGSSMTLTIGAMMMELRQQFRYRLRDGINIQDPSVLQPIINRLERQSERLLRVTNLDNLPIIKEFGVEYNTQDNGADRYLYRKFKEPQSLSNGASVGGLFEINGYEPTALTLKLTGTLLKASGKFRDIGKRLFDMSPNSEQKRQVYLGPALGWHDCLVYRLPNLREGEALSGPVLIEAVDSVYWVPSGWRYVVGAKGVDRIEREVSV